ncbi:helix-turn-helix transcriptional regulator [Actinomycetota bacterium Odt1-20B]
MHAVARSVPEAGARADTVGELGAELSRHLGRLLPHDGYLLTGYDPLTGARCFLACENSYDSRARRRMDRADALGRTRSPVAELVHGACPAVVLGAGAQDERPGVRRLHGIMAADGYGSELCVALSLRGVLWGTLVLLRERGSRPFSPAENARAAELAEPLTRAVRRYVTDKPLRPRHGRVPPALAPGVVVIGGDDTITGVTAGVREAARGLVPGVYPSGPAGDQELFGFAWHITYTARRTAAAALTRAPTPLGWLSLTAQPLECGPDGAGGQGGGSVVVTLQPASTADLLPVLAQWYGISGRERTVVEHALEGLAVKQIARRLDLSPHTVNDHFKAVYRKTGVTGREELLASLSP